MVFSPCYIDSYLASLCLSLLHTHSSVVVDHIRVVDLFKASSPFSGDQN